MCLHTHAHTMFIHIRSKLFQSAWFSGWQVNRFEPWVSDLPFAFMAIAQAGLERSVFFANGPMHLEQNWLFDFKGSNNELEPFSMVTFAVPFTGLAIGLIVASAVASVEKGFRGLFNSRAVDRRKPRRHRIRVQRKYI